MNARSLIAPAACALVIAGVALGFSEIGSPLHNRQVVLDGRRVDEIDTIAGELTRAGRDAPALLPPGEETYDPAASARNEITYLRTGRRSYQLCATFDLPSSLEPDDATGNGRLSHPAGRACFAFETSRATGHLVAAQ
jgi:hypothetical protein